MSETDTASGDRYTRIHRISPRATSENASLQNSQEDLSNNPTATSLKLTECSASGKTEDFSIDKGDNSSTVIECAVCLQTCIHPVKLPCTHIFCYLCVKGVAFQSKRCAMCRQEIPADFLLHPQLLDRTQLEKESTLEDGYQWFYEGRNGWWQYDERTSFELECAYKRSQRICELLIAGFLYMIDFDQMFQSRKTEPSRRRRIKRDLASIPKKGVAGLRLEPNDESENGPTASLDLLSVAASRAALVSNCLSPSQTPQAPSNTPQTPQTPQTPRSPPSPAPESISDQEAITETLSNYSRWQERERRRLRRAVEEIERLRLHDGDRFTPPLSRLDNMVIYYNMDEERNGLHDHTQDDLWPSEDSSSDDEEEVIIS
ncbi:E3 ubiquitin-protein ligase rnf146-like [Daphnia carinata]|uniref:E3 ubiquitin-protein ligase rnf146-like n=1 Tax=Daphnia carinata TaxID=120202 RepID=UPI00258024F8|nr:E3 ubiquitin-protein ligase rnf146-like [Daphnia carinata]